MAHNNEQGKGWYSRGYLPHFDQPYLIQGITFRLHDSLPVGAIERIISTAELESNAQKRARAEELMNAGYGACYLRQPTIARLVEEALLYFDGDRYRLLAWVVMPNHVHVLLEQEAG